MKISITSNFSFKKLASQIKSIIEEQSEVSMEGTATAMKNRLRKGLSPSLKPSTLKVRKLRGIVGGKPLVATGNLLNSIRGTKDGVKMSEYGQYQHEGFTPKKIPVFKPKSDIYWFKENKGGVSVPARPFIFPDEKSMVRANNVLLEMINKSLKSSPKVIK